jgi:FKBP-type peptidyl-prolyl cis-trans isomerase
MLRVLVLLLCLVLGGPGLAQDDHDHDHDHDHDRHGESHQAVSPEKSSRPARVGDTAEVYYVMRLEDGTLLDATRKDKPFKLQIGQPGIIPGFSLAMVGMTVGETKQVLIPPELGYGNLRPGVPPDASLKLQLELVSLQFPEDMEEVVHPDDDGHGHHSANLPAMMDFMLKDFFARPWIDEEKSLTATRNVTVEALGVFAFLIPIWLLSYWLDRRRV